MLAWDHALCRAVVAVYVRAVLGWLRSHARDHGVADGRGGAVAIVQRFGAALNLNVHIHALVMDGVFAPDGDGGVRFCPVEPMGADDLDLLLTTIERRIERLLARRCVPVRRWGDAIDLPDPPPLGRWHARQRGFDLHAGIVIPADARDRLERLCRYALRPPVGQDRLQLTPDGKAVLELLRRWTDGTTHLHPTAQETRGGDPGLVFEPVELLERLAALTPRPRINWVLDHGVLAPHRPSGGRASCLRCRSSMPLAGSPRRPRASPPMALTACGHGIAGGPT